MVAMIYSCQRQPAIKLIKLQSSDPWLQTKHAVSLFWIVSENSLSFWTIIFVGIYVFIFQLNMSTTSYSLPTVKLPMYSKRLWVFLYANTLYKVQRICTSLHVLTLNTIKKVMIPLSPKVSHGNTSTHLLFSCFRDFCFWLFFILSKHLFS